MRITTRPLRDDELMHWKYIKRERKNGKWVYYYDESSLNNKKRNIDRQHETLDATRATQAAAMMIGRDVSLGPRNGGTYRNHKNYQYVEKYLDGVRKKIEKERGRYSAERDTRNEANKIEERARKKWENLHKKVMKNEVSYYVEKVAGAPARAVSKGIVAVANLLSGNKKKKKKKK